MGDYSTHVAVKNYLDLAMLARSGNPLANYLQTEADEVLFEGRNSTPKHECTRVTNTV